MAEPNPEAEMFERSFERPRNYFKLSDSRQWEIDKDLGILDWGGGCAHGEKLCALCMVRFRAHYGK